MLRRELWIVPLDPPLVGVRPVSAQLNPWLWPNNWSEATDVSAGASFNLFSNLSGCNYIYWYPWRNSTAAEDNSAMTFRWVIQLA